MWIAHPQGFASIIKTPGKPGFISLRFRSVLHARRWQAAFPASLGKVEIEARHGADYALARMTIPAVSFPDLMRELAGTVTYSNVKGATETEWGFGDAYVTAMHEAWSVFHRVQDDPKHRGSPAARRVNPIRRDRR